MAQASGGFLLVSEAALTILKHFMKEAASQHGRINASIR